MDNSFKLFTTAFIKRCSEQAGTLKRSLIRKLALPVIGCIVGLLTLGSGTAYLIKQHTELVDKSAQLQTLQNDYEELTQEHHATIEQLDVVTEEKQVLEDKAQILQTQNKELEESKNELEQQKGQLEQQNADLERQLQAKRESQNQQSVVASAPSGTCTDWISQAGVSDVSNAYWLIMKESGCRVDATNASSGAYGIPQALPGSKMASAGADWQTNPITQIRWMDSYVNGRYGGWAQAVAFWQTNHWY